MMKLQYPVVILFTFCYFISSAQTKTDSILKSLAHSADDTNKVKILILLGNDYFTQNYDSAILFYNQALDLADKIKYSKGIIRAKSYSGALLVEMGKYDLALQTILEAMRTAEETEDSSELVFTLSSIGNIYYYMNQYEKTLAYYERSYQISQVLGMGRETAIMASNIGLVYDELKNYDKALQYYHGSLTLYEKAGISSDMIYNNIGVVYDKLGKYKEALENTLKAAEMLEKKSILSLKERENLANFYNNIGSSYLGTGHYSKAIEYCNRALELAIETNSMENRKEIYKILADIYSRMNDFQKAYQYQKLFTELKDTLLNTENTRAIADMQTKYETEKKEKEIALLTKDKQLQQAALGRQQMIIWSVTGGVLLLVIIALLLYRGYWLKQRANVQLEKKNQTILLQKDIIEQKNKDITDSIEYARYLQEAVLPDARQLKKLAPESFIFYKPKDIISGDFYWFCEKNGKIMVAACDCTGHGVPGALLSVLCNNLLFQAVFDHGKEMPDEILSEVNRNVLESMKKEGSSIQAEEGMDASLCVINKKEGIVYFAGANHTLTLIRDGKLEAINGDFTPVGGTTPRNFSFSKHVISAGSRAELIMSTDGYYSQFGGPKGKKLTRRGFKEIITRAAARPIEEQQDIFSKAFADWKGNVDQVDDVLVIGIRV